MIKFIFLLLVSTSFVIAGTREEAIEILERFKTETSVTTRLDVMSKTFLGLPYGKSGPLGEGPTGKYDQDPLYRFDTFDCTTYVETMMALALSHDVDSFEDILNKIRYENGEIDFLKRNHFTDLQWIPYNIENGLMKDVTKDYARPENVLVAEALINFPGWLLSLKKSDLVVPYASEEEKDSLIDELHAEATHFTSTFARLPYITIASILKTPAVLNKIPSGTIVNFVRPNWDLTATAGTHQNISHQGFLFRVKNKLILRHASTSGDVQELVFLDYLKKFENHPTLKGIHLMRLN